MLRSFYISPFFLISCYPAAKMQDGITSDNYADVYLLAKLIQDNFEYNFKNNKSGKYPELTELVQMDSTKRIANSFEKIEFGYIKSFISGGYSIYFKFSSTRANTVSYLTDKEKEIIHSIRWQGKKLDEQFDGEIQIAYPEKGYHFKRFIIRKK